MKLNLVAASLCMLGLVSTPALANQNRAPAAAHDYKDMALCTVSPDAKTMIETSQNVGRSLPNPCKPGWYNRIRVSGGINVDVGKWGNRNGNLMGENYQPFSLNDVYLNIDGKVNDWTRVFASINYMTATTARNPSGFNWVGAAEYSAAYANNIRGTANNNVQLEQAYGVFGNFEESPFYLQVGKSFQDFSRYEIHPITRSLTQVMSETLATSLKLGFINEGWNGDVYLLNDPINKISSSATAINYGISVGYNVNNDQFGWDLGAGYLYNLIAANDIAWSVTNFTGGGYNSRVGGVALYGDLNYGPIMLAARYTQSVQRFNRFDMTKNGAQDVFAPFGVIGATPPVSVFTTSTGAKPWAGVLQAGYGFELYGKSQNVYVGYQTSRETAGMNLPKYRYLAGYGIDVVKNTSLGLEWDHDQQFSANNGGGGKIINLVSLRASAKFA